MTAEPLPSPADEPAPIGVISDDEVTFYPPAAEPEPPTVH